MKARRPMKSRRFAGLMALWFGVVLAHASSASDQAVAIDAGRLQDPGGFVVKSEFGVAYLANPGRGAASPAVGAILLPHAGKWRLWITSRSLPEDAPGERQFSVRLGDRTSGKAFGVHHLSRNRSFVQEDGGVFDLAAGPLLIVVGERNTGRAQCGRILLTDELAAAAAAGGDRKSIAVSAAQLAPLHYSAAEGERLKPSRITDLKSEPDAAIDNGVMRLAFFAAREGQGIVQRISLRDGGGWKDLPGSDSAESYRVLYRDLKDDPNLVTAEVQSPTWNMDDSPYVTVSAGGGSFRTHSGPSTAPWLGGRVFPLRPRSASRLDSHTVRLEFEPLPFGTLSCVWSLGQPGEAARVTMRFKLSEPGYVSLGYHGAVADSLASTDFVLLPYLYGGHRFPDKPVTVIDSVTPTPLSLVTREGVSYAVTADPAEIPFGWPEPKNPHYALGLRNEDGAVEPMVYAPVLGSPASLHKSAGEVVSRFEVFAEAADWTKAYSDIATGIFRLTDYREPVDGSLSDTALNLLDLMKANAANGWSPLAKGPWNIESRNTVTQASPLTYLSLYLLTGDDEVYRSYALPSLEYMLSRPAVHFAAAPGAGELWNPNLKLGPLTFYGASVFASAFAMTQGGAPEFGRLAVTADGTPAPTTGEHHAAFEDALQLFEVTGDDRWRQRAVQQGDQYIDAHLRHLPEKNPGDQPFINVTFVPDWEGLLHLFEATREPRFLEAARQGAYWLLTTLWTQPAIPRESVDVAPYDGDPLIWWKGDRFYRLGEADQPAPAGMERPRVGMQRYPKAHLPAWEVSNVGLGLEQPVTYVHAQSDWNILMSVWAPNLLRLYQYTGDTLFQTAARNATIGRFANYPGYYQYFQTDVQQRADYPYKGPDATTIYYHHIPAFAAYVLDYLYTDVAVRSKDAISFPAMRQDGYVWFDNDVRGFAPGTVYGETAWPWLHRTAAAVDSKNVNVVLAHNDHTLFAILSNQVQRAQSVRVSFDGRVLGGPVDGRAARLWTNNERAGSSQVHGDGLPVTVPAMGLVVVALDGVSIHVSTQTGTPKAHYALPPSDSGTTQTVEGSPLKARGTFLAAAPFQSRELYVYVEATAKECSGATLLYRVGAGPEERAEVKQFPCEFSVPLKDMTSEVRWSVSHVVPGR